VRIGVKVRKEVDVKVGIEVSTKIRMTTIKEVGKASLIIRGFERFKVRVGFSGKSQTLKEASLIKKACS
jgi:hypothetical protein